MLSEGAVMCMHASRFRRLRLSWRDTETTIRRATNVILLAGSTTVSACSDDPVAPPNVSPARPHADVVSAGGPQIEAGYYFTCGIRTDARVRCWGSTEDEGQTAVPTALRATQVSAAFFHACAVEVDGTVTCWGARPSNPDLSWVDKGQTGPPAGLNGVTQVVTGAYFSCALRATGTVVCWGDADAHGPVPQLSGVTELTAGDDHACALKSDGTVTCWGNNGVGQAPAAPAVTGVTQLSAGDQHTCAAKSDGTVACWGRNSEGETAVPPDLGSVSQIAAGGFNMCALKANGTVRCWGENVYGQSTPPAGLTNVIQVTAGRAHACALKADLSVVCWGSGAVGIIPSLINRPPTVAFNSAVIWWEGVLTNVPATVQDPDGDALTYAWTIDAQPVTQPVPGPVLSRIFADDGAYIAGLTVSDGQFSTSSSLRITILNGPAKFGAITAPNAPVASGAPISIAGPFTDLGRLDTHTAFVRWGAAAAFTPIPVTESNGAGTFAATRSDVPPGVYQLTVRVTDNDGAVADSTLPDFLVVYDASGTYVTGKGAIQSPAGACQLTCYGAAGRATFGFTSRYEPGAKIPSGTTQFQFKAGNLDFASTQYQWLVVAGARAQYKGEGTINGGGIYGFLLTAIDGELPGGAGADKLRIKIWDKNTGLVVYDNQQGATDSADPTTAIASGAISIRK